MSSEVETGMSGVDVEALRVIEEGLRLADQFFDGQDGHWEWDDGEAFPASKVRAAVNALPALLAKSAAYDDLRARVESAPVATVDVDDNGWALAVTLGDVPLNEQAEALNALHGTRVRLVLDAHPSDDAGDV